MLYLVRVLIADTFESSGRDALAAIGCEVLYQPQLKEQSLLQAARDLQPDVIVVRSTPVGEAVLEAGSLKLVVRAGAGYNTIDVAAASKRGIYVSICPGKNSVAVAELAFGLILALDRHIADNVISLRWAVEQDGVFPRTRAVGPHVGLDRHGTDRTRDDSAGTHLRHGHSRLEPQPDHAARNNLAWSTSMGLLTWRPLRTS